MAKEILQITAEQTGYILSNWQAHLDEVTLYLQKEDARIGSFGPNAELAVELVERLGIDLSGRLKGRRDAERLQEGIIKWRECFGEVVSGIPGNYELLNVSFNWDT